LAPFEEALPFGTNTTSGSSAESFFFAVDAILTLLIGIFRRAVGTTSVFLVGILGVGGGTISEGFTSVCLNAVSFFQ
jgi:hypothetical protein